MKKLIAFLIILILISFCVFAQENESNEPIYSLQIKPILYLFSGFLSAIGDIEYSFILVDIEFQYKLSNKFTLFINPSFLRNFNYYGDLYPTGWENVYSISGLNLIMGLLYRPYETGLKGMYVGMFPIIGWGYISHNNNRIEDLLNIGYMVEAGYQWIFKNGFTITLGGGICDIFSIPKVAKTFNFSSFPFNNMYGINLWQLPFDFRIRFSIGYSF